MTTFIRLTNKKPGVFLILGFLFIIATILSTEVNAQDPFITTWKTDNSGVSDPDQITIPTTGSTGYNYDVYWEEVGTPSNNGTETGATGDLTIDFGAAGTYRVEITGDFPQINFYYGGSPSDAEKILTVEQWGDIAWGSMGGAFYGAANLEINATDAPDLSSVGSMWCMFCNAISMNSDLSGWDVSNVDYMSSLFAGASAFNGDISTWTVTNVTDMSSMFIGAVAFNGDLSGWNVSNVTTTSFMFGQASAFNGDLSGWDVSGVTEMQGTFADASSFNQSISTWDVSNVMNMTSMFDGASAFDQDISTKTINPGGSDEYEAWDVSNVTTMSSMFKNATSFNQNIGGWDVSGVVDMSGMFQNAIAFNQDISSWVVSNVSNMGFTFLDATAFNQDISGWNVSAVTNMADMFAFASVFDQDLGGWNVSNVANMNGMLDNSGLSTGNYDNTLTGWSGQTVQSGVTLGAIGLEYCNSETERQSLIDDDGWTITGDVPAASCEPSVQLSGMAGFRMLSSPVEVTLADLLDPIWTQGASGADYTGGDPNVWTWNIGAGSWDTVTDLSTTVSAGTGVLVYVFDEDDYGVPSSAGFPKTLSVSGTVNSLPQSPPINSTSEGFTLLGNPVNTGIAWNDITRTEVDDVVYVWDPNKSASGDYVIWSGGAGDLTNGVIHPFQGFFVQTSPGASSPSLTITASAATSPDDFFGKDSAEEPLVVRLHMEGETGLESTAWLQISDQGSLTANRSDAMKLQPLATDYAVLGLEPLSDDESFLLALKHLPLEMQTPLEIPLTVTATHGGEFTLAATDMRLPAGWSLSLRDTRTGEQFELEQGTEYSFELEANEQLGKTPPYQSLSRPFGRGTQGGVQPAPQPRPLVRSSAPAKDVGTDGSQLRFLLTITPAGAIEVDLPDQIALEQNYPNPFNPTTQISYQLPQQSQVRLEVYDMVGRRVAMLVDEQVAAGTHQVNFDARNLSSGVYLYRLQAGSNIFTKKLTLIK